MRLRWLSTLAAMVVLCALFGVGSSANAKSSRVVRASTSQPNSTRLSLNAESTNAGQSLPNNLDLRFVVCPSTIHCVAVGSLIHAGTIGATEAVYSLDGGISWSKARLPNDLEFNRILCSSAIHCLAVGVTVNSLAGAIAFSTNGGTSWSKGVVPSGVGALDAVSCASTRHCVAVGHNSGAVLFTQDGGASWSNATLPGGLYNVDTVSCPSKSRCIALGSTSHPESLTNAALLTTDGGASWSKAHMPSQSFSSTVTACQTMTHCVAVGLGRGNDGVRITTDGGSSWTAVSVPPSKASELVTLSCPSPNHCVAFHGDGEATFTTDGGHSWSEASPPGGFDLTVLSCPSSSRCVAVGPTRAVAAFSTTGGASLVGGDIARRTVESKRLGVSIDEPLCGSWQSAQWQRWGCNRLHGRRSNLEVAQRDWCWLSPRSRSESHRAGVRGDPRSR